MTKLTTTGLITEISSIESQKLQYKARIAELKGQLEESDLVKSIKKGEQMLKDLEEKEVELKTQGIQLLQKSGIDKFETNGVEVKLKVSPGRLVVPKELEEKLPDEYRKMKTTFTIDKVALKKDIQEGLVIDGVTIEQDVKLDINFK